MSVSKWFLVTIRSTSKKGDKEYSYDTRWLKLNIYIPKSLKVSDEYIVIFDRTTGLLVAFPSDRPESLPCELIHNLIRSAKFGNIKFIAIDWSELKSILSKRIEECGLT